MRSSGPGVTASPSAGKAFEVALSAALGDPSLVFDAMTRRGVEAVEAAFTVADTFKRLTGEFPSFGEER